MKHYLLFLILLIPFGVQGHEYIPFNLNSGVWYCKYDTKGGMFGGNHGTHYAVDSVMFYCSGDTLINDKRFEKLLYRGYTSSKIVERTFIAGYYGAIRNDTLRKKVYFVPHGFNSDYEKEGYFLYDFDLDIGDSIRINCWLDEKEPISHIDSVLYCNTYHRRYKTSSGYSIIEGIGSKTGLIPIDCLTNIGWLFCYQEKGNDLCNDCGFITSINTYKDDQLHVFPNPTDGKVQIISDLNIQLIELFDIQGKLLDFYGGDVGFVELNEKGFYVLRIHTDSALLTIKLINE